MESKPLVSIAIPTYKRSNLFERALQSVLVQDYDNVEILISDNNFDDKETLNVLNKYYNTGKNIKYFSQENNLGSLKNLFFLLKVANGQYFMWLADDDEIEGSNYLSELVSILNYNPSAVTAYANWKLVKSSDSSVYIKGRDYKSDSWILRSIRFFWFPNDDFFYGLHRINSLRQAKMYMYLWPNKQYISNWAYVYLFDQILRGPVIQSKCEGIAWVNHDYTEKNYTLLLGSSKIQIIFKQILRRINVYGLYLLKIRNYKGFLYLLIFIPISFLCLLAESISYIVLLLNRLFRNNSLKNGKIR